MGAPFKYVTGNLVENSSAVRIEFFNGVNEKRCNVDRRGHRGTLGSHKKKIEILF